MATVAGTVAIPESKTMLTLPGDAVRQIQWRFSDRFDLQMLVASARGVARGTVARLVAAASATRTNGPRRRTR